MWLYKKVCRHLYARICKRRPASIQSLKIKKDTASAIYRPRKETCCRFPKNEVNWHVTSSIRKKSESNWAYSGKILYYVRVVENTWLVPLITMATKTDPTEQDKNNIHQFLDYMVTYSNAIIRFHASGMILRGTHVSYITKPQSCSRNSGYFS